jgi:antitoxin component YwqK of YwqJK toxin-antitoxin module
MKLTALILFIFSSTICYGQGVRFQLYRTKACSTVEKLDSSYSLYKIGKMLDTSYLPKSGTVYLPGPGKYGVLGVGPIIDTVFDIRGTGLFIARLREPDAGLYITGATDTPPLYTRCDSLLDGYQEYQYPNGDLKMRGTFRKGRPKDSIVTFYPGRRMEERIIISPKVVLIEEFDEAGHKIKVAHNQNKSFMTYREYRWEEYFPDGKIKRKESSIKDVVRIEEFYPGGQLKLKQTKKDRLEYYEDGKLNVSYSWKNIEKGKDHWNTYKIYQIKYDHEGKILQSTIFEDWGYITSQPKLDIKESDWIVKVEKYRKGEVDFSVEGMDTKDYIKKYPVE